MYTCNMFFLSKIKTLIYQGHIKFIKIDSKAIYNVKADDVTKMYRVFYQKIKEHNCF